MSFVTLNAQVYSNFEIAPVIPEENAFLDASTAFNSEYAGTDNNIGKGLIFPSVDLTTFAFKVDMVLADGAMFATYFDGMIVYNRGNGKTLTSEETTLEGYDNPNEHSTVSPGFYYFSNPKGHANENASLAEGKWLPLGGCCCDGEGGIDLGGDTGDWGDGGDIGGDTGGDTGGETPGDEAAPTLVKNGWATVDFSTGGPGGLGKMAVSIPDGSTVQWYNVSSGGTPISEAAGLKEWDPQKEGIVSSIPGVYTFYAETFDGSTSSATRTPVTFTVCGAPNNTGGLITFMCHNLGANQELDPFKWDNSLGVTDGRDIKGGLYQWGRKDPAHAIRSSTREHGRTDTPSDGIFYIGYSDWRLTQDDTLWGDGTQNMVMAKADDDPCPAGWKVPSNEQWGSIYGMSEGVGGEGGLHWDGTEIWVQVGGESDSGYKVGSSLYLPSAGDRTGWSSMVVGMNGMYWSSTVHPDPNQRHARFMQFNAWGGVTITTSAIRSDAHSVRCIAE